MIIKKAKYKKVMSSFIDNLFIILILIVCVWVLITLTSWLLFNFDNESLMQVLRGQWRWVSGLKIF